MTMTLEEFIEKCKKQPVPNNPLAKIKLLAREMAEGASYSLWKVNIRTEGIERGSVRARIDDVVRQVKASSQEYMQDDKEQIEFVLAQLSRLYVQYEIRSIITYLCIRWNYDYPDLHILHNNNYIVISKNEIHIVAKAFELLEQTETANIFISYKRSESSAFALLIHDRLKQIGLSPFVDMQLQAGADWHAELEQNIKKSDYFIILLGLETLNSSVTIQEIQQAIKHNVKIIPIWHNSFVYNSEKWDIPSEIDTVLSTTHTIRVIEENPLTYETALRELLNRFGITL